MDATMYIGQAGLALGNTETEAAKLIVKDSGKLEDSASSAAIAGDSVTISDEARELQAAQTADETADKQEEESSQASTSSGAFYQTGSLSGKEATSTDSSQNLADLSDQIDDLEEQIEELENEIAELEAQVKNDDSVQGELDAKRNELATLESRLAMLKSEQSDSGSGSA